MGYTHGKKYNEKETEEEIKELVKRMGVNRMPSHNEIKRLTKSTALSNRISRSGGFSAWAKKLGYDTKDSESKYSYEYEIKCKNFLETKEYESVEMTPTRFPYDILINGTIKIEVKASRLYKGKTGNFYSFNLEYRMPKCDVYVFYCEKDSGEVETYIIPGFILNGKNQLSIGENKSKYHIYKDQWHIVDEYVKAADFLIAKIG